MGGGWWSVEGHDYLLGRHLNTNPLSRLPITVIENTIDHIDSENNSVPAPPLARICSLAAASVYSTEYTSRKWSNYILLPLCLAKISSSDLTFKRCGYFSRTRSLRIWSAGIWHPSTMLPQRGWWSSFLSYVSWYAPLAMQETLNLSNLGQQCSYTSAEARAALNAVEGSGTLTLCPATSARS